MYRHLIKNLFLYSFISFTCFGFELPMDHPLMQAREVLEQVHYSLFDFYFPKTEYLNQTLQEAPVNRHQLEQHLAADYDHSVSRTWEEHKNDKDFLFLLSPLALQYKSSWEYFPFVQDIKNKFSDIYEQGFISADYDRKEQLLVYMERHPDNTLRQYAASLRKLYISIAYSEHFPNHIAGLSKITSFIPKRDIVRPHIPESKLYIQDKKIFHKDGPIDYLIIGSGPAGSLIAHELAKIKKDCRILVIERGPFVVPGSIVTESHSELMESNNRRTDTLGAIFLRNGSAVGGGTTVNLDLAFSPMLPCIQRKLHYWIEQDWMRADLFHKQNVAEEENWYYLQKAYEYVADKIQTRTVEDSEINTNNQLLLKAAKNAKTYDLNSKCLNDGGVQKISAVDAFLLPALQGDGNQSNVSLISDALVTRILFEDDTHDKVKGIEFAFSSIPSRIEEELLVKDLNNFGICEEQLDQNGTYLIEAKNIIICAGTLGSAELLLRSAINNKNIGKGIVIHPSMGICARFKEKINAHEGLSTSVYAASEDIEDEYFFEAMSAEPAFIGFLHQGSGKQIVEALKEFKHLGGFGIMLVDSVNNANEVCINPETNLVEVKYQLSDVDKIRFRKAIKTAVEMILDQGALEVFIPTIEPILSNELKYFPITSKDQVDNAIQRLRFLENENFISSAHMQGSNKMGSSPVNSVVSTNFRVWNTLSKTSASKREIANLYVVDSSVFPTSIGANPMQSIYTIAKLFVDKIINKA